MKIIDQPAALLQGALQVTLELSLIKRRIGPDSLEGVNLVAADIGRIDAAPATGAEMVSGHDSGVLRPVCTERIGKACDRVQAGDMALEIQFGQAHLLKETAFGYQ